MALLAIETSCDETSVAIVKDGRVLAGVVSSQTRMHEEYGGVVPELAAREHLKNFLPVAREALDQARIDPASVEAVSATQGPGLPGALMIGLKAGQALAFYLRCPFVGVHHHEAHLYSPWIKGNPPAADFAEFEPNVSLIVSGGHTMLVHVESELKHRVLGSTMDDAAGECFDKVGKLLGLAYPAGPLIDRLATNGNPAAFDFPRPMISDSAA
jgi:N6-L-threonylcarbamoyladenine synthase